MKNKVTILIMVCILTVGSISIAYAASRTDTSLSNHSGQMMSIQKGGIQSNDSFNNMIKSMKDSGFNDEANAMENKDIDGMNKLMTNLKAEDYKKMIDIMQKNGYTNMAKMMRSVSREDMAEIHQSMMGR